MEDLKNFITKTVNESKFDYPSYTSNRIVKLFKNVKTFGEFFIAWDCVYNGEEPVKCTSRNLLKCITSDNYGMASNILYDGGDTMREVSNAYYGDKNKINDIDDFEDFIIEHKNDKIINIDISDLNMHDECDIVLDIADWNDYCRIGYIVSDDLED